MHQPVDHGSGESIVDVEDLAPFLKTRLVDITIEPVSYRDATTWNIRSGGLDQRGFA